MAKNIEIKARIPSVERAREVVVGLTSQPPNLIQQVDTFFQVPDGRLKVRAFADGSGELISYHRPNTLGPKESAYTISPCDSAATLMEALKAVLPIRGTVRKRREVFFVGRTRVHLDQVESLGSFLELEVVLGDGDSVEGGTKEAQGLLDAFGITEEMLVAEAYIDLLAGAEKQNRLSSNQREEFAQATERASKIRGAGRVATFNGWTLAVCSAVSLLLGMFSVTGLMVGICLAVVAWNEFRGRERIRRFDPSGPRLLGWNQVGLMSLVVAYCLWSMFRSAANPSEDVAQLEELAGLPGDFVSSLTMMVYGLTIVLTLLFQGLNARYYFSRVRMLTDYLKETPGWIIDLQRTNMSAHR